MISIGKDGTRVYEADRNDRSTRYNPRGGGNKNQRYNKGGSYRGGNDRYQGSHGSQGAHSSRSTYKDRDGDINMESSGSKSSNPRYNPYGQSRQRTQGGGYRGSTRGGRQSNMNRNNSDGSAMRRMGLPFKQSASAWHRITIPHGKTTGKEEILKLITLNIDTPVQPIYFSLQNKDAHFYVNDFDQAEGLRSLSRKLTMPNGFKMVIIVKSCGPPIIPMDEDTINKLRVRMSARFDAGSNTLDLNCLYKDPQLVADKVYLALNRVNTMTNVVKIIKENIPELVGLDLSNNRLLSLSHVADLVSIVPNLKKLNLAKNQLRSIHELNKIKGWQLEHLVLEGNDMCSHYKDKSEYISAVRQKFPKVVNLDDNVLPPPIVFELESPVALPPSKGSYFLNEDVHGIVIKFLKEYYSIYDSDNRQPLINAYHQDALFSCALSYNGMMEFKQPHFVPYNMQDSRNIIKSKDTSRRLKSLKFGHQQVVSQLCLQPKTTHDLNSFIVDINMANSKLLTFTLSGLFKETDNKSDKPPIRTFSRMFVTVPLGSGIVITNDLICISNATSEQVQSAFKITGPTPSSSPVLSGPSVASCSSGPSPTASPVLNQKQLVVNFCMQSGMNEQWSIKCLQENGWDYAKAGQVFLDLHGHGKIPPEAFVKV